jgi:hypothetical protein
MNEGTLRRLAEHLLTDLPTEIPDPLERAPVADAIGTALTRPEGTGTRALTEALSSHDATRRWMLLHAETPPGVDVLDEPGSAGNR